MWLCGDQSCSRQLETTGKEGGHCQPRILTSLSLLRLSSFAHLHTSSSVRRMNYPTVSEWICSYREVKGKPFSMCQKEVEVFTPISTRPSTGKEFCGWVRMTETGPLVSGDHGRTLNRSMTCCGEKSIMSKTTFQNPRFWKWQCARTKFRQHVDQKQLPGAEMSAPWKQITLNESGSGNNPELGRLLKLL